MTRSYSVRISALAIAVEPRWLDNLLSRFEISGVSRAGHGVERRISDVGLLTIEVVRVLNLELGVSLNRAVEIARHAISSSTMEMRFATASGLTVAMSLDPVRRRLLDRLTELVDAVPRTTRGRPPMRRAPVDPTRSE